LKEKKGSSMPDPSQSPEQFQRVLAILRHPPRDERAFLDLLEEECEKLSRVDASSEAAEEFFTKAFDGTDNGTALLYLGQSLAAFSDPRESLSEDAFDRLTHAFSKKILANGDVPALHIIQTISLLPSPTTVRLLGQIARGNFSIESEEQHFAIQSRAVSGLRQFGAKAFSELPSVELFTYVHGVRSHDEAILSKGISAVQSLIVGEQARREKELFPEFGFTEFTDTTFSHASATAGERFADFRYRYYAPAKDSHGSVPSECRVRAFASAKGEPLLVFTRDGLSFGEPPTQELSLHAARFNLLLGLDRQLKYVYFISPTFSDDFEAKEVEVPLQLGAGKVRRAAFDPNDLFEKEYGIKNPAFLSQM
jgi:hypothetical protein